VSSPTFCPHYIIDLEIATGSSSKNSAICCRRSKIINPNRSRSSDTLQVAKVLDFNNQDLELAFHGGLATVEGNGSISSLSASPEEKKPRVL
jgi:hypothetical protein